MPTLTIAGANFNVEDDPAIAVGTPMTEGHVAALQQTRRENLRNNFASRVKDAAGEGQLSDEQRNALQTELDQYAAQYQFGVKRSGGGRQPADPVEREAVRLAKMAIENAYRAQYNQKIDKDILAEKAQELMAARGDDYRKKAQRNLRETGVDLASLGLSG